MLDPRQSLLVASTLKRIRAKTRIVLGLYTVTALVALGAGVSRLTKREFGDSLWGQVDLILCFVVPAIIVALQVRLIKQVRMQSKRIKQIEREMV